MLLAGFGRSLSEEETLKYSPETHRKLQRHNELQEFMHSLD